MIYLTSDTHFCHDKPFIYEPRGFSSIQEMNETLIENWNGAVSKNDIVYVLGDFFLGTDYDFIKNTVERLNGNIYLIYFHLLLQFHLFLMNLYMTLMKTKLINLKINNLIII